MFRFIKTLEREVLIAAVLVIAIAGFTTEGFGGAGRSAMTAMAETQPASDNKEKDDSGQEILARGEKELLQDSEKRDMEKETEESAEYGQQKEVNKDRRVLPEEESPEHEAEEQKENQTGEAVSRKENASLSQEDYEVLLKIVEAEAGICDAKGKILVANVILNRVRSTEFPDSVTAVVYQPSQFSPVSNGSINTCMVSSETVESVNRALKGEDYSQGALFFMNRAAARSGSVRWFDGSLTYLFGHQGHEFFK